MVERVRLIQRALVVGFSLKELGSALGQRDHGAPPCRKVRALMGDRLQALEARLVELTALQDEMRIIANGMSAWPQHRKVTAHDCSICSPAARFWNGPA
jgi:DNA-binding transcriptional MerR regulator